MKVYHTEYTYLLYEQAFSTVAKKYSTIIGVRSPNPLSFSLLKDGFPSKNFHVKAKSSPTGPTAGFITEDPKYSKTPINLSSKHINYIHDAKSKGAKLVHLIITKERIAELISCKHLTESGPQMYTAYFANGTGLCKFIIDKNGGVYDEFYNKILAITNPPEIGFKGKINEKPITADYDLFAIIPKKNHGYNQRPLQSAPILLHGKFNLEFLSPKINGENMEDPNKGNIHFFGEKIIENLNKEIQYLGYTGGKLVWHNDETGNPFSPGFDAADKPIFFLPSGDVFKASSKNELMNFYSIIKNQGYEIEYSARFGF